MIVYLDLVILLNFLIDLILILAVNRYCLAGFRFGRAAAGAALGGAYGGACLLPGFSFLSGPVWRLIVLALICITAFGITVTTFRRGILFVLLNMTLGGFSLVVGAGGFLSVAACIGMVLLCTVAVKGRIEKKKLSQVCVFWKGKEHCFAALHDTGNSLSDPLTGQSVLIVGADIAREILDLDSEELRSPAELITRLSFSGMRLIPFRTVGDSTGMLLSVPMDSVTIDGRQAGRLVAFSPVIIGQGEEYKALTGG